MFARAWRNVFEHETLPAGPWGLEPTVPTTTTVNNISGHTSQPITSHDIIASLSYSVSYLVGDEKLVPHAHVLPEAVVVRTLHQVWVDDELGGGGVARHVAVFLRLLDPLAQRYAEALVHVLQDGALVGETVRRSELGHAVHVAEEVTCVPRAAVVQERPRTTVHGDGGLVFQWAVSGWAVGLAVIHPPAPFKRGAGSVI
jgi:hypothetical protein